MKQSIINKIKNRFKFRNNIIYEKDIFNNPNNADFVWMFIYKNSIF